MPPPSRDRRFFVVYNPRAGIASSRNPLGLLKGEMKGLDLEIRTIGRGEDIRSIVTEGVKWGATDILAAGGDGTVSGVAGALAGSSLTLGIIPSGTANMLARELGVPISVTLAARLIRRGLDIIKMDALGTGDRCFVYQVVIGPGSEAASKITRAEKRMLGRTVYALAGLRLLTEYHPIRLKATIDGREVRMWANQVMVANAGILGLAPLRLGPDIRPDDGKVEMIAMRGRTRMEFLDSGLDLMFGNYTRSRGLRYFTARHEIELVSDPPALIKADGEFIGRTPLTLKVMPGAVNVLAPGRQGWKLPY